MEALGTPLKVQLGNSRVGISDVLAWGVRRLKARLKASCLGKGWLRKSVKLMGQAVQGFGNHTRAARRRVQQIQRMRVQQRHQQQTKKYRELIGITEEVVTGARGVLQPTRKAKGEDLVTDWDLRELRQEIEHYCQLGEQGIDQARCRVLDGEQVPAAQKLYSIFEPRTDLIKRGKVETPIEFGHKVFLADAQGLITQYELLKGNPCDEDQVEEKPPCSNSETAVVVPELMCRTMTDLPRLRLLPLPFGLDPIPLLLTWASTG
ncbi:MAG: hypothetical protein WCA20_22865 [Candidatus Sulfotelmatobacter sp.]